MDGSVQRKIDPFASFPCQTAVITIAVVNLRHSILTVLHFIKVCKFELANMLRKLDQTGVVSGTGVGWGGVWWGSGSVIIFLIFILHLFHFNYRSTAHYLHVNNFTTFTTVLTNVFTVMLNNF